jgi:hypothetical protein
MRGRVGRPLPHWVSKNALDPVGHRTTLGIDSAALPRAGVAASV